MLIVVSALQQLFFFFCWYDVTKLYIFFDVIRTKLDLKSRGVRDPRPGRNPGLFFYLFTTAEATGESKIRTLQSTPRREKKREQSSKREEKTLSKLEGGS